MADLPSIEDLERLSLRAIVAYAARCARRVQPLYRSSEPEHVRAVERAIAVAESLVRADDIIAAAYADAAYAAAAAADAAAQYDFRYLLSNHPRGGDPIGEPFEVSDMGPLWPKGEPEWYSKAITEKRETGLRKSVLPNEGDLQRLSRRGMVAYAARSARRVQPLFRSENREQVEAVEKAIAAAETFASGGDVNVDVAVRGGGGIIGGGMLGGGVRGIVDGIVVGGTAAMAAVLASRAAVSGDAGLATKSVDAARSAAANSAEVAASAGRDYEFLLANHPTGPDLDGAPVDFSVMGPLWPEGEPEWYTKAVTAQAENKAVSRALPTEEDLQRLTLRAIVAYATRCARMVEGSIRIPDAERQGDIKSAITSAESIARGQPITSDGVSANAEALEGLVGDPIEAIARATCTAAAAVTRHQRTTVREALAAADKAARCPFRKLTNSYS